MLQIYPPKIAVIGGKQYRINTEYLCWMGIQQIFSEPNLTDWEKANIAITSAIGCIPLAYEEALEWLFGFLQCGEESRGESAAEKLIDWEKDFQAVWADFKLHYRLDIRTKYLHWWDFMAMLQSLPKESEIKRRISIRGIDLSKIKDSETREEYRKQKEMYSLDTLKGEDMDSMYSKARWKYARAQM